MYVQADGIDVHANHRFRAYELPPLRAATRADLVHPDFRATDSSARLSMFARSTTVAVPSHLAFLASATIAVVLCVAPVRLAILAMVRIFGILLKLQFFPF